MLCGLPCSGDNQWTVDFAVGLSWPHRAKRGSSNSSTKGSTKGSRPEIFQRRFPWSWRWALIWEHFWDTVGNLPGRFVEPPGQQIGLGVGVAPAGEAPLAVEVERVVGLARGRRGRGPLAAP